MQASYRNQSQIQSQSQNSEIMQSQNIGQSQQQYMEQNSLSLQIKQLNIPCLGPINKKQLQFCPIGKQKSQFSKNVFQLQNEFYRFSSERWSFSSNKTSRFPYLIWGKHQLLKNIANFSIFFTSILQTSKRRTVQIELDLSPKLPEKVKGATICLTDESKNGQKNLYQTTFCLVQKMRQIQQTSTSWTGMMSVSILLPRMLVPVVMGKQGRILGKIKSLSECDIIVHGPYYGCNYNYQDIQINSPMIENISKSIYLIYLIAYKALRTQPITIPFPNIPSPFSFYLPVSTSNSTRTRCLQQSQCSLQLLLPNMSYRSAIQQHEKYIDGVREYYGVETKVGKYGVYSRSCQHQPHLKYVVYCVYGALGAVQLFVNSILRVLWFQNCLDECLTILLNQPQARSITSLSGKILRDMSCNSNNCYIQLREKDKQQNRIVIKGDIQAKIKAACLICQFICFQGYILGKQRNNQPIQYICELVEAAEMLEKQLYCSENQGQGQGQVREQGQRYKRIKKQKKGRRVKIQSKHSMYRQRQKQRQKYKWNKRVNNKNINNLSQQQINYRVAYLLTEHMNSSDN